MPRAPRPPTPASPRGPRLVRKPTRTASTKPTAVPHEQIAVHAYWLFLQRGCVHGHDVDDWLKAERGLQELAASMASAGSVAGARSTG